MHGCDKEYVSKYKVSRNDRTGRESQNCNLGQRPFVSSLSRAQMPQNGVPDPVGARALHTFSKPRVYQTTQTDKRDDKVTIDLNTLTTWPKGWNGWAPDGLYRTLFMFSL